MATNLAKQKYDLQKASFFRKGVAIALSSGICFGTYSAFLTLGMERGVWADWYGPASALSAFVVTYVLSAVGSAVNDTLSGIWFLILSAARGKLADVGRTFRTKPGLVMIICALIGGPLASTAYVVGLQTAGSLAATVAALNSAIGAILGRLLFKQTLNLRMVVGIIVCFGSAIILGGTTFDGEFGGSTLLGLFMGFLAALGWGIEGCVAGFGTSVIDSQVGVTIRQCTSGLANLIILVPLLCLVAGNIGLAPELLGQAFTTDAIIFFVIAALPAGLSYMLWYRGTAMCGAALGMTCNGAYAFWVPLFCWILLGLICGEPGWALTPVQWAAAFMMFFGIFLIAMNPLDLLKKKEA
ncbi:MAG: hypothetical protein IJ131_07140 [Eggerthellaceae bacterium]|nr:hypothetical protein [Eggerthellaceae bacterium]